MGHYQGKATISHDPKGTSWTQDLIKAFTFNKPVGYAFPVVFAAGLIRRL